MTAETAKRDTLSSDDPFDMERSGALPLEGSFFLAKGAGIPLSTGLTDAEVDFSFLDGAVDGYAPRSPHRHHSLFMERRAWSSLAIVLLLHATFACILPVFGKTAADTPQIIETQLVLLPGGSGRTGGQPAHGRPVTPKGEKTVSPAASVHAPPPARPVAVPPPPAPVNRKSAKSVSSARHVVKAAPPRTQVKRKPLKPAHAARVHKILPQVRKVHARAKKRPRRAAAVFHHPVHRREVTTAQPIKPSPIKRSQTEPGEIKSQSPQQNAAVAAPGTGKPEKGAIPRGGPGKFRGPGGPGASDVAFGSPHGPRFLHKVAPVYPASARKLGMQGTVLLRVTIDARGRAVKVEVLRKAGFGMDEAAVKAVEESTFVPARRDGKPFTCKALLPIKFVLDRW